MYQNHLLALGLSVVMGGAAMAFLPSQARAAVLISDSFNRADSSSLGSTDQGAAWTTRAFGASVSPEIKDNALYYSVNQKSMPYVSVAPQIQDFILEYDIQQTGGYVQAGAGLTVNFRMNTQSGQASDGGTQSGYALLIAPAATTSNMMGYLLSDYATKTDNSIGYWYLQNGTEVTAAATSVIHVKVQAEDNHIQVWLNGTQTIDYTDLTANPAADSDTYAGGYFSFNANGNKAFALDNLVISSVPEPATATLLALAGAGLLMRRRRSAERV